MGDDRSAIRLITSIFEFARTGRAWLRGLTQSVCCPSAVRFGPSFIVNVGDTPKSLRWERAWSERRSASRREMTALVALAEADTVLVWDPADRRLIAANLRGTMPWTEDLPAR